MNPTELLSDLNLLEGKSAEIGRKICDKILNEAPDEPVDASSFEETRTFVSDRLQSGAQTRVCEMAEGLLNLEDKLMIGNDEDANRSLFSLHAENKAAAVKSQGKLRTMIFLGNGENVSCVKLIGPPSSMPDL